MSSITLPKEIIIYHIIPCLRPEDALNVLIGCHVSVTEQIYHCAFHDNTQFDHYDLQMFQERLHARLYVFGKAERFFKETSDSPCIESGTYEGVRYRRIFKPCEVEDVGCIEKVWAGIAQLEVLNSNGELYFAPPYSEGKQVDLLRAEGRRQTSEDENVDLTSDEEEQERRLDRSIAHYEKPYHSTVFTEITSAIGINLALDSDQLTWCWVGDGTLESQGVPMIFRDFVTSEPIKEPVTMLRASNRFAAGFVRGRGIFIWRDSPYQSGWTRGYHSLDGMLPEVEGIFIPDTVDTRDFVVSEDSILILQQNGTAAAASLENLDRMWSRERLPEIQMNTLASINYESPFSQITTNGTDFALRTNTNQVYVVSGSEENFEAYELFSSINCLLPALAGMARGMTNNLFLTNSGEVYAYGGEYNFDGCLGLGRLGKVLKMKYVSVIENGFNISKAVKLDLPGKVYGVYAGLYYAAVLMFVEDR